MATEKVTAVLLRKHDNQYCWHLSQVTSIKSNYRMTVCRLLIVITLHPRIYDTYLVTYLLTDLLTYLLTY